MKSSAWLKMLALLLSFGVIAAACGDSDDDAAETDAGTDDSGEAEDEASDDAETDDGADAEGEAEEGDDGADDAEGESAAGVLADVCPETIVIQTDWWPEAEHGALYEMIGDDYAVDVENKITSGSGQMGGEPLGVNIEVRAGGPAIGFAPPRAQMYTDDAIHFAYSNTDSQSTAFADLPIVSVIAPLEKNPQMIMWDAEENPDVETIADLGEAGIPINLFSTDGFPEAFVAQGIWTEDQLDPSYDGTPARFIAERTIAQQGFASAEPYNYEFVFEEYGKAPAFQLLHDAGWEIYSQTLTTKPERIEELRPCLEQFVPVVQQSIVNYANDPARTNAMIVDVVAQFDSDWVYSAELAEWSTAKQLELGLIANGPDSTIGNIDEARVQAILDAQREAGVDIPEDLTATDMFTNEFIDESIGL